MLLIAVKERAHGGSAGELLDGGRIAFYLGISRPRGQSKLTGKDVKNAGEADKCGVLGDRAARKFAEIKFETVAHEARYSTGGLSVQRLRSKVQGPMF